MISFDYKMQICKIKKHTFAITFSHCKEQFLLTFQELGKLSLNLINPKLNNSKSCRVKFSVTAKLYWHNKVFWGGYI